MEVSVDTRVHRRDTAEYETHRLDGVELLLLPELAGNTAALKLELKTLLFFRNLKAEVELTNGEVFGRRALLA